jgi:hypothetical protein
VSRLEKKAKPSTRKGSGVLFARRIDRVALVEEGAEGYGKTRNPNEERERETKRQRKKEVTFCDGKKMGCFFFFISFFLLSVRKVWGHKFVDCLMWAPQSKQVHKLYSLNPPYPVAK